MMNVANFHFLRPYWLLAIIPLLVLLWFYMRRGQERGSWSTVCDPRLLPHILMGVEKRQSRWQVGLIGLAGLISLIALAGPAWERLPQPVFRDQSSLVIVLDLSRSMDATDIRPSRLIRARLKMLDILHKRREGQTALVVYAGESFVVTPLTQDTNTIGALVNTLNTDLMPKQGSRSSVALKKAAQLLKQAGITHGDILLVTDGIDDADTPGEIKTLARDGQRVSILGVGTKSGAPIPADDGGFLKDDQGNIVIPKLNDSKLRQLASLGGGIYQHISIGDRDINALSSEFDHLQEHKADLGKQNQLNVHADLWREEGPWLLLLVIPFAAMAFRRGYLMLLLGVLLLPTPQSAYAFGWADLWRTPDQQAAQALKHGKPDQAAKLFQNRQWQGAANYRAKNYKETVKNLTGINTPDALYNKANALARLGQFKQAIDTYDQALKIDPKNKDAKYNRDLLKKYMKNKQQGKNQKQDNNQQSKNDNKDNKGQGKQSQQKNGKGKNQQQQDAQQNQNKDKQQQNQSQQASGKQKNQQAQNQQQRQQQNEGDKKSQQAQQEQAKKQDQSKQQKQQSQQAQNKDQADKDKKNAAQNAVEKKLTPEEAKKQEQQLANEQWLRRIPDDPGGLLRRKFLYQSQLNQDQTGQSSEQIQPW